jgi:hypothetical protein
MASAQNNINNNISVSINGVWHNNGVNGVAMS